MGTPTLRERIAGFIGGARAKEAITREAYSPLSGMGAIDTTGNAPDSDFRRLSGDDTRNLPELTQARSIELAFYQWKSNPMAKQIIQLTTAYLVGRGVRVRCASDRTQAVVDAFWKDPVNAWDAKLTGKVRYLLNFGEQFYPLFVHPTSGRVRMAYIDPARVSDVVLDADNCEVVERVEFSGSRTTATLALPHIKVDDADGLYALPEQMAGKHHAAVDFWSLDRPPNASRGTPYLLAMLDWLDILDTFMMSLAARSQLQMAHAWDVTIDGADDKTCAAYLASVGKQRPGTIRAHNQRVKWEAISPNLVAEDASKYGQELKKYIGSGAGFPPHWLGEEGSSNRATAAEMGVPVVTFLVSLQNEIKHMIERPIAFAIDMAVRARMLDADEDRSFEVVMPTIWGTDSSRVANALAQMSISLDTATSHAWVTDAEAGAVFRHTIGQLGIDLEAVDESTGERTRPADREQQAMAAQALAEAEAALAEEG